MHASPPPAVDQARRGRALTALGLAGAGLVAAAAGLDWSEGPAMALGQMAGLLAPPAVIGLGVWALAARSGRKG